MSSDVYFLIDGLKPNSNYIWYYIIEYLNRKRFGWNKKQRNEVLEGKKTEAEKEQSDKQKIKDFTFKLILSKGRNVEYYN